MGRRRSRCALRKGEARQGGQSPLRDRRSLSAPLLSQRQPHRNRRRPQQRQKGNHHRRSRHPRNGRLDSLANRPTRPRRLNGSSNRLHAHLRRGAAPPREYAYNPELCNRHLHHPAPKQPPQNRSPRLRLPQPQGRHSTELNIHRRENAGQSPGKGRAYPARGRICLQSCP